MNPKDMPGLRDHVKDLERMAEIADENNMARTASECRLAALKAIEFELDAKTARTIAHDAIAKAEGRTE